MVSKMSNNFDLSHGLHSLPRNFLMIFALHILFHELLQYLHLFIYFDIRRCHYTAWKK